MIAKSNTNSQRNTVKDKTKTLTRDISRNELLSFNNNINFRKNLDREKNKSNEKIHKIKKNKSRNPKYFQSNPNDHQHSKIQVNPPSNSHPYPSNRMGQAEPLFHPMQLGSPPPMNIIPTVYPIAYNHIPMTVYPMASPVSSHLYYPNVYPGATPHQYLSNYPSTIHSQHSSVGIHSHQSSAAGYGLNQYIGPQPMLNLNGGMNNYFPYVSPTNNLISTSKQAFIAYQANTLQSTLNTQNNGYKYAFDTISNNCSRRNISQSHISEDPLMNPNNSSMNISQLNMTTTAIHPNMVTKQNYSLHKESSNSQRDNDFRKDKTQVNMLAKLLNDSNYKSNKSQQSTSNKNIPNSSQRSSSQISNQCIVKDLDNTNNNVGTPVHKSEKSISNQNTLMKCELEEKTFDKKNLIFSDNLSMIPNVNVNNNNTSFQYKSSLNTNSICKDDSTSQCFNKFESFNSLKQLNIASTKNSSHLEIQAPGLQVSSKQSYETRESTNKQVISPRTVISPREDQAFTNTCNEFEKTGDFKMNNILNENSNRGNKKAEKIEIIFDEPKVKDRKFKPNLSKSNKTNKTNKKHSKQSDSNRTSLTSKAVRASVIVSEINLMNADSDSKISNRFSISIGGMIILIRLYIILIIIRIKED